MSVSSSPNWSRSGGAVGTGTGGAAATDIWLSLTAVSKRHPDGTEALSDVTLELGPGVVGLVGPNGAGKSTLLQILATLTRPTGGRIWWRGGDAVRHPDRVRRTLGYLPQNLGVYPYLTAPEFLAYLAALRGLTGRAARARIDFLLEAVGLADARHRPLGHYSGGMLRRIGVAQALLPDPQLVLLDEPTAGVDPGEQARLRSLLADLGRTRLIIFSTHLLRDLEAVADRLVVLRHGRVVWQGPVGRLRQECPGQATLEDACAWLLAEGRLAP